MNKHQLNIGNTLQATGGEIILLTGANGSGKTLWLQRIAGIVPAPEAITMNQKNVQGLSTRMLGEQWPPIWLGQTVAEEMIFGLDTKPDETQINESLSHWDLNGLPSDTSTQSLNRLQSVRVNLACISMAAPALTLLDNPTDALPMDDATRLIEDIVRFATQSKSIVVVACNRWQDWRHAASQQWLLTTPDATPQRQDIDHRGRA